MDQYRYRHRYRSSRNQNPSFSSTLLDFIYQSVDQTDDNEAVVHTKATRNVNQSIEGNISYPCSRYYSDFSLSEAERIYGFPAASLRPLRTSVNEDDERNRNIIMYHKKQHREDLQPRAKFVKTKSRAMKIYSYLKKGTQPISPGGRLASFLTSFFSTKNATKSKISPPDHHHDTIVHADDRKSKSAVNVLTPSSGQSNGRYYPTSVNIIKESLNGDRSDSPAVKFVRNSISKEVEVNMHVTGQNRHVEQTTRNLLKDYGKKVEYVFDSIENNDEDGEDDETASYSSSDLFELDHLSTIGTDHRCMQELPLYETTSVVANRAIAKGLLE